MLRGWQGLRACLAGATLLLLLVDAASSDPTKDFYWQARRSSNWSDGINAAGVSNWYSQRPPNGIARSVPGVGSTAIFGPGARSTIVNVTRDQTPIAKIAVAANTVRYTFNVEPLGGLIIQGTGLVSSSALSPRINIKPLAELILRNGARFYSSTAARPAYIFMDQDSNLAFEAQSLGGSAWVKNTGGSIRFYEQSSAQSMTLTNAWRTQSPFSRIDFRGRSTGGKARIINHSRSTVNFTTTLGPAGDGSVSAARIDNFGYLLIGTRRLVLSDTYVQSLEKASGLLDLVIYRQHAGALAVTNRARLGGVLRVNVVEPIPGLLYTILAAGKGIVGKFSQIETTNVNMPYPKVVYSPNKVQLYFNP